MIASYVVTRHVPMMAIVTAVVVLVFGTLTLILHDETFIKMKPTIVYSCSPPFSAAACCSAAPSSPSCSTRCSTSPPQGWRILTMRWALWFFAMAVLNEIIWRTQIDRLLGRASRCSAWCR